MNLNSMVRRLDWRSRLQQWAAAQIGKPFEWGQTDCASLGYAAVVEMFGQEIVECLPPKWDSARGALLTLEKIESVGAVLEQLGAEKTSPSFMRSGDILVSAEPEEDVGQQAIMVCIDGRVCLASTRVGVAYSAPEPSAAVYSLWEVSWEK